ncbi:transposable element Tcb1 transposase [Trichonephila clavipes]|nr:transposable element Tcb1 transposase [Trichonephila clavipes]
MSDLSEFQRGMIVGVRLSRASVMEAANLLGLARSTTTGRIYFWRTPREASNPEWLLPTLKHEVGSTMVCDDNASIHTARCVQEWFEEHDDKVEHLAWPPRSPDLNIIEHLWEYLEFKLHSRFPPNLPELETVMQKEWLDIPLNIVNGLYACIPRLIKSVLPSKAGPILY